MPGWIRWVIYIVLLIGLVGAIIWGYQEQQEKNAILIKAENNYQRSFHDLTYRMDELDEKISTVLAMNAPSNISPQMANIWKLTSEAKADVSQLPLSLLPFNQTKQLLNQIGDFAYDVSIRDLNDQPLNDQELQALSELKDQSNQMKRDLRQVQNQVLTDGVRWMDIEVSVATNDQQEDEVLNGLQVVEDDASQFDGLSQLNDSVNEKNSIELTGESFNQSDIEQVVKDYFELNEETELTVTETGEGSEVPIYNVSFDTDSFHGYAEITKQGGNVLSYLLNRDVGEPTKSLHDGRLVAETLLEDLDYDQVEMVESKQYEKTGVYKFVHVHDDIHYYPDEIQVKVALDDGQVTGLTARDFILNENKREEREFEPTLSEEEALDYIHEEIDVQTNRLAVIETEESEEVLAYEVLGTIDGTTYRVYINANDGFEERVERLTQSEEVY